jgi:hypothetical protein
MDAPFVLP